MIQIHNKRERRGMHIPMLTDGGEGKILIKGCVVKDIEHRQENRGKMKERHMMKEFAHLCQ